MPLKDKHEKAELKCLLRILSEYIPVNMQLIYQAELT